MYLNVISKTLLSHFFLNCLILILLDDKVQEKWENAQNLVASRFEHDTSWTGNISMKKLPDRDMSINKCVPSMVSKWENLWFTSLASYGIVDLWFGYDSLTYKWVKFFTLWHLVCRRGCCRLVGKGILLFTMYV